MPQPWIEQLYRAINGARFVNGDPESASLTIVEDDHRKAYTGELFTVSDRASLAGGATDDVVIRTGDNPPSIRYAATSELALDIILYEEPTVSALGTPLTPFARNRGLAANESLLTTTFFDASTVTDPGQELLDVYLPGGQKNSAVGGAGNSDVVYVLKPDTDYLLRVINLVENNTNEFSLILTFYEDVA